MESIQQISTEMIARYSKRYAELGNNVKTLGWGSSEQQTSRFLQTFGGIYFDESKDILDIGCGFGDYLACLLGHEKNFRRYLGWDINPDLVGESKKVWAGERRATFEVVNISEQIPPGATTDIAVMLGVLNLNLGQKMDNYQYSERLIRNAFAAVRELLVVDFLSNRLTPDYPREEFVFYHDPVRMLEFALTLTNNVEIKHDYPPIPQKEFMLFLRK